MIAVFLSMIVFISLTQIEEVGTNVTRQSMHDLAIFRSQIIVIRSHIVGINELD